MRYVLRDGKLVPKHGGGPSPRIHIQGDYPDHVSPIDGAVIGGRAQRRDHMRRHDVIDAREFGHKVGSHRRERDRQQQS